MSSKQQICFTKTTTVKKFLSLVDSDKIYKYWFKHWLLNREEYSDFYLTQLGIGNGSVIQIDDVNKEVFFEDFLKDKNVTKKTPQPHPQARWKLK